MNKTVFSVLIWNFLKINADIYEIVLYSHKYVFSGTLPEVLTTGNVNQILNMCLEKQKYLNFVYIVIPFILNISHYSSLVSE